MNIFWLDEHPELCARWHCDQHVIKMLTEYAQVLGEALKIHGCDADFLAGGFEHHPQTQWAAHSRSNWDELYDLARALYDEKLRRYGPPHSSWTDKIEPITDDMRDVLPERGPSPKPFSAGDLEVPVDNIYLKYRWYYLTRKAPWARYDHSDPPWWLEKSIWYSGVNE